MGNTYTDGIILSTRYNATLEADTRVRNDPDGATLLVTYPLDGQYSELSAKIVLPQSIDIAGLSVNEIAMTSYAIPENDTAVDVLFYGDGNLLGRAVNVSNTMPYDFKADVSDVSNLTVKVVSKDKPLGKWTYNYTALTDPVLR